MQSMFREELPDELLPFKHRLTDRFYYVRKQVIQYIQEVILPNREKYDKERKKLVEEFGGNELRAPQPQLLKELQEEARKRKIWNLFLPEVCNMSVLEYSPIAEILGAFPLANLALNCSAPDTGNMEVLEKFATPEQRRIYLEPLLNGEIRSCFAMTEPGVASSDATNICTRIESDGENYVINGHKWFITGAFRPECKFALVVGRTTFVGPIHQQQSMVIVPMDTPGVKLIRANSVFGQVHDHAEIIFDNVRVPKSNIILGEGRGFEIAQARLGPGRIHHCMRSIGMAEMAMEAMTYRAHTRTAFGSKLAQKDSIIQMIGKHRIELTKCRQLLYSCSAICDEVGFNDKRARHYIAMIKYTVPQTCLAIIDDAIQLHGAHGVSQDSALGRMYLGLRTLRIADGSDLVHLNTVGRNELSGDKNSRLVGMRVSGINPNINKYKKFQHISTAKL